MMPFMVNLGMVNLTSCCFNLKPWPLEWALKIPSTTWNTNFWARSWVFAANQLEAKHHCHIEWLPLAAILGSPGSPAVLPHIQADAPTSPALPFVSRIHHCRAHPVGPLQETADPADLNHEMGPWIFWDFFWEDLRISGAEPVQNCRSSELNPSMLCIHVMSTQHRSALRVLHGIRPTPNHREARIKLTEKKKTWPGHIWNPKSGTKALSSIHSTWRKCTISHSNPIPIFNTLKPGVHIWEHYYWNMSNSIGTITWDY